MGTNSFGGNPVTPGQKLYESYILTATPLQLNFPNDYSSGENLFASYMNITSTADGQIIKMPPANQSGRGVGADFINIGSFSFIVQDFDGNLLLTMQPLTSLGITTANFFLIDNTTEAGVWNYINRGAANSSAQAENLVGYGLVALSSPTPPARTVLNTNSPVRIKTANFTTDDTYRANVVRILVGTEALLSNPVELNGFYFDLINSAANGVIINANGSTINGVAQINLAVNDSLRIVSDGTAYFAYNLTSLRQTDFNIQFFPGMTGGTLVIPFSTLNTSQSLIFTGTLTSNLVILLSDLDGIYYITNNTDGSGMGGPFTFSIAQDDGGGSPQGTVFEVPTGESLTFLNVSEENIESGTPSLLQIPPSTIISGSFLDGSVFLPSIDFANALSSGFYLANTTPPVIGLGVNATNVMTFAEDLVTFATPVVIESSFTAANFLAGDGTLSNCAFGFVSSPSSGYFYSNVPPATVTLAVTGQEIFEATPLDLTVVVPTTFNFPITLISPLDITSGGSGTDTPPTKVGQSLFSQTTSVGKWGGFSILQIQSLIDTTQQSFSSSAIITSYTLSLTTSYANSRIFVIGDFNVSNNTTTNDAINYTLLQNDIPIFDGDGGAQNVTGSINFEYQNPLDYLKQGPKQNSIHYLTPTLSLGTYVYKVLLSSSGAINSTYYNRSVEVIGASPAIATSSSLYLIEIGGF